MIFRSIRFRASTCTLIAGFVIAAATVPAFAGPKCGGPGGNKTETYTCGAGQYVMGLDATGSGFVHNIKVQCTDPKISAKIGGPNPSAGLTGTPTYGGARCPNNQPVNSLDTYCGLFVDSIRSIECGVRQRDGTVLDTDVSRTINVGGRGGARRGLSCSNGTAIYRVRVKYGAWIDSIEVFCR